MDLLLRTATRSSTSWIPEHQVDRSGAMHVLLVFTLYLTCLSYTLCLTCLCLLSKHPQWTLPNYCAACVYFGFDLSFLYKESPTPSSPHIFPCLVGAFVCVCVCVFDVLLLGGVSVIYFHLPPFTCYSYSASPNM